MKANAGLTTTGASPSLTINDRYSSRAGSRRPNIGIRRSAETVRPMWWLLGIGLALNPWGGLLPFFADPQVFGSDFVLLGLNAIGVAPWAVFAGHLGVYGLLLGGSLVTLRPPLDLERALAESQGSQTPA